MMQPGEIETLVASQLKDAQVKVRDLTGGGDHFEIEVVSTAFEGVPLLERHRMMHRVLEAPMKGAIHAVKYITLTPQQKANRKSAA